MVPPSKTGLVSAGEKRGEGRRPADGFGGLREPEDPVIPRRPRRHAGDDQERPARRRKEPVREKERQNVCDGEGKAPGQGAGGPLRQEAGDRRDHREGDEEDDRRRHAPGEEAPERPEEAARGEAARSAPQTAAAV